MNCPLGDSFRHTAFSLIHFNALEVLFSLQVKTDQKRIMKRSNKILILVNASWNETCLTESGLCRSMYANTATSKVQPYRFDSGLIGFSAGKSGKKVSFNKLFYAHCGTYTCI